MGVDDIEGVGGEGEGVDVAFNEGAICDVLGGGEGAGGREGDGGVFNTGYVT